MILFLFLSLCGSVLSCARTADVGTTTVKVPTTTLAGVTTTTLADVTTTTVPTTTGAVADTTTTTTTNLALTCKSEDVTLMVETGVAGSIPTGGPVVVENMANTMTITCVAATTTMTQISFNDGTILLAPGSMVMETLVCNAMGKWTLGNGDVITNAACNDA